MRNSSSAISYLFSKIVQDKRILGSIVLVFLVTGAATAKVMLSSPATQDEELSVVDNTGEIVASLVQSEMLIPLAPEPEQEPEPEPEPELPLPPPPPPPLSSAEDVFAFVSPRPPDTSRIDAINAQRRGQAASVDLLSVSTVDGEGGSGALWENSQEDWPSEGKTRATFPVEMSRVFTVDRFMQCLLYTAMDSELPGKVVLVVEQNLYGAHGRKILIPAGSKLVGYYRPMEKVGDERLSVVIERLITPDGIDAKLENAEVADAQGRSGITGEVDDRFVEKYGLPLLIALVDTAVQYQVAVESTNQANTVANMGAASANISRSILEENMNIKPKIRVPQGTRLQVSPMKDIWFKKPKNGTIQYDTVKS
ncbi:MAG: TrbI/VirB10 family protein [Proteobacteria bacterium]|nr:TrbI/VirB10 family protein [Pseudomonadota bacterium]